MLNSLIDLSEKWLVLLENVRGKRPVDINYAPTVLVDFDGVIHLYEKGWTGIDDIPSQPVPDAIEWLKQHLPVPKKLSLDQRTEPPFQVVIFSARCRERRGIVAMRKWFIKNGLDNAYFTEGLLRFTYEKIPSHLIMDDRCLQFPGKFPTDRRIMEYKPWFMDME